VSAIKGKIMDTNDLYNSWKQLKGKVKKEWGELTDDDIQAINGNMEELVSRLISTYGYTKEYATQAIHKFLANSNLNESLANMRDKLSQKTEEVKENVEKYSSELYEVIKKSPVQSVLIASTLGLLMGLLLRANKN
jgi:uncharacterized protein YjbJ (UPF0337 family)